MDPVQAKAHIKAVSTTLLTRSKRAILPPGFAPDYSSEEPASTTVVLSNFLISVDYLASGCEPHPFVLLEVRNRFFEVGRAPRLSHKKRMKRNSHDACRLLAVGV